MEKRAIIDPQITPAVDSAQPAVKQADTSKVAQIQQLDSSDLSKQLANVVANTLKKS